MPDLTGPFDTNKLHRIAPGAATIIIARTIAPGSETRFNEWSQRITDVVSAWPGCLGAVVLRPGVDSDEYHTVFRFVDAVHLRNWERSDQREALRAEVDDIVLSERFTVTSGSEEFFQAQTSARRQRSRLMQFVFDVVWIYPLALGVTILVAPYLAEVPLVGRVLMTTVVITLGTKLATGPLKRRLERRWMLPVDEVIRRATGN